MTALCRCGGSGREVIHHPSGNGAEVRRCRACGGTGIPYPTWAPTSLRGVALEDSTPQPDGTHLVRVRLDTPSRVPAVNEVYLHREMGAAEFVVIAVVGSVITLRGPHEVYYDMTLDDFARDFTVHDPAAPPRRDGNLSTENAALRSALAASGELLAEAHAEIERLRGER